MQSEGWLSFETKFLKLAKTGVSAVCDLVELIIREGIRCGASDIHVEPASAKLLVRYRLDGVLHPPVEAPTGHAQNVVARIKVLAELLTYQTDVPQEGRIDKEKVSAASDLRVSTFPTVHGEKAVIRLFDAATQSLELADLGYAAEMRDELAQQLQMPTGMLLLTGPAGSGKTTTIYASLNYILTTTGRTRNIVSVEDPVERVLDGVTQTQVRPGAGLTFARCLRSLMRQDPEVIVIGEVRDRETAAIATEAGLTGHLVISTIHSGNAPGVFTRLLEMGVEPYLVASSVRFVVAQRLVRKLCGRCRRVADGEGGLAGLPADLLGHAYEAVGCEECFGTGYRGRTVIAEALKSDERIRQAVLARSDKDTLARVATDLGMTPLAEVAVEAARRGITSPAEVRRVLGPEVTRS